MQIALESWYTLDHLYRGSAEIVIRLVPDHFTSEIVEPVITVSISEPLNPKTAEELLARFHEDLIVDLAISPNSVSLWGEYDDEPVLVSGNAALLTRSQYSPDDLLRIVKSLENELHSSQASLSQLSFRIKDIETYASELLDRENKKKSLTTRNTTTEDARIEVLQRLLNRIKAA